jgi:hypothetical protein
MRIDFQMLISAEVHLARLCGLSFKRGLRHLQDPESLRCACLRHRVTLLSRQERTRSTTAIAALV